MRVYLPATLGLLRAWHAAGSVGPPPLTGYAVTPALREWYAEADAEELEYAATARAARAALRLLAGGDPPRRVVLALDAAAEEVQVRDDLDDGAVQLAAPLPWRKVAAGLVDDEAAAPAVARAAQLVDAADLGDEDAELAVGDAEDHTLAWYATQELGTL